MMFSGIFMLFLLAVAFFILLFSVIGIFLILLFGLYLLARYFLEESAKSQSSRHQ